MPRRSAASLAVQVPNVTGIRPRLIPPAKLPALEQRLWDEAIGPLPADYFGPAQRQQLVAYVRHAAMAEKLAQKIARTDPEAEGWATLSAQQIAQSKAALAYARSLRLTLQAVEHRATAGRQASKATPGTVDFHSYFEGLRDDEHRSE